MISPLTLVIASPLLAALLILFVPQNFRFVIRVVALLGLWLPWGWPFMFSAASERPSGLPVRRRTESIPWVESVGINYHVGVDGVNVGLILMGAIVALRRRRWRGILKRATRNFTFCC